MSKENYLHILILLPKLNLNIHEIVMSRFLRVNNPYKECKILISSNLILLGTANVNQDNYYPTIVRKPYTVKYHWDMLLVW